MNDAPLQRGRFYIHKYIKERFDLLNYFEKFNSINYGDQVKQKNNLSYLPWAIAWGELKKVYPMSYYTVYENPDGWMYFTDGRTCWVKTGVTAVFDDGTSLEHIERLPIMDHRNQPIPFEKVTASDANKSIQRSLTKACARHGIGLYVYQGEEASEELQKLRREVIALAKKKITAGAAREAINAAVSDANDGNPNPNAINSVSVCEAVLAALESIETKKGK